MCFEIYREETLGVGLKYSVEKVVQVKETIIGLLMALEIAWSGVVTRGSFSSQILQHHSIVKHIVQEIARTDFPPPNHSPHSHHLQYSQKKTLRTICPGKADYSSTFHNVARYVSAHNRYSATTRNTLVFLRVYRDAFPKTLPLPRLQGEFPKSTFQKFQMDAFLQKFTFP